MLVLQATAARFAGAAGDSGFLTADLTPEVRAALEASAGGAGVSADPSRVLERIFAAAPPFRFSSGLVTVHTDRRWFATLPQDAAGAPMLEIRRWPGDTVLALYALEGDAPKPGGPTIPNAKLTPALSSVEGTWRFEGTVDTLLGERRVLWLERRVPGVARRLGAFLAPGDAGLGPTAVPDLLRELVAAVSRIEIHADAWEVQPGVPSSVPLLVPPLDFPPEPADERKNPWQVIEGGGFTLGLPPGIRGRRLDQGVAPPRPVSGGVLWLRGRFVDRKGTVVSVGDGDRAGYASVVASIDSGWSEGKTAPLGAPGATRLAAEDFSVAVEETGALAGRADRWSEPGFEGQWLVFRLLFNAAGIEIGLPVLSGRTSESLFWIPATLRPAGQPPAAPPVDPAERFGIRFERFTRIEQTRNPWLEGYLTVPGLRLDIPRGWIAISTLRSDDGFPVTLIDGRRELMGRLLRIASEPDALAAPSGSGWVVVKRPTARKPLAIYRHAGGESVFLTGDGIGYRLVPEPAAPRTEWGRLSESARVTRSRPGRPAKSESR